MTIGTGAAPWERFGHNLIRIRAAGGVADTVWDWGRFSFDTERFLVRFAQGDLRYWMQSAPAEPVLGYYARTGRRVIEQHLALTPDQATQLLELLRDNDTDANRYYQYHYYLDNCSTRIRDALDQVLGGALRAAAGDTTPRTFRDETRRLNEHNPALYLVLTTLLADWTDRRMTVWEEMFLPEAVAGLVAGLQVPRTDGSPGPLVRAETVIAEGGRYPVPARPSRWWMAALAVGSGLGLLLAATARSRRRWARRVFRVAAGLYLLVAGVLGLAMALLWAVSGHEVAWRNENLWQFNLGALAMLALLPRVGRHGGRAPSAGRWLVMVIAAASIAGLLLKVIPGFDQDNWDIIALALPANLGLAAAVLRGRREVAGS